MCWNQLSHTGSTQVSFSEGNSKLGIMEAFTPEKLTSATNQVRVPLDCQLWNLPWPQLELLLLRPSSCLCFHLWPVLYFLNENLLLHRVKFKFFSMLPPSCLISQEPLTTSSAALRQVIWFTHLTHLLPSSWSPCKFSSVFLWHGA